MFYIGYILGVWNRLIQFTLFLMGKFNSKFEQLESRTVSWNGKFEVPLYIYMCVKSMGFMVVKTYIVILWFTIPCSLVATYQCFGSSMFLQNVGNHVPAYEGSTQKIKMHNVGGG
jgi:hypothetical protein